MEDGLVLCRHHDRSLDAGHVLILIVVEDGLVHLLIADIATFNAVLILIVVEDGLVQQRIPCTITYCLVLILIVVEDGLVLDLIRLF